jgi:hypothetical protein
MEGKVPSEVFHSMDLVRSSGSGSAAVAEKAGNASAASIVHGASALKNSLFVMVPPWRRD